MIERPTPERLEEIREASRQAKALPLSAHIRAEITLKPEAAEELLAEIDVLREERDTAVKELKAWKAGHLDSHRAEVATLRDALKRLLKEKETWGNEFSAVMIMKDQLAQVQAEAAQMRRVLHKLTDYCPAENEHKTEDDCRVYGCLEGRNLLKSTTAGKEIIEALEGAEEALHHYADRMDSGGTARRALEVIRKARGM